MPNKNDLVRASQFVDTTHQKMINDVGVIEFPEEYGCQIELNIENDIGDIYLGNVLNPVQPRGTITLAIDTDDDMQSFAKFFYGTLLEGTEPFYIKSKFFGITKYWLIRITGKWNETLNSDGNRDIKIPFELRENVSDTAVQFSLDVRVFALNTPITITVDTNTVFTIDWGDGQINVLTSGTYTEIPFGRVRITAIDPINTIKFGGDIVEINFLIFEGVTNCDDMCDGLTKLTHFKNHHMYGVTSARNMFRRTALTTVTEEQLKGTSDIRDATSMFEMSDIMYFDLDTTNWEVFKRMFAYCHDLLCLARINTSSQTDTDTMLIQTNSLYNPTAAEIPAILTGTDWVNTNPCPFIAPTKPLNFDATDGVVGRIDITWDLPHEIGYPHPTFDLYKDDTLYATNVTSPHTIMGNHPPAVYFVRAKNINGKYADSDVDNGHSGRSPSVPTNFQASDIYVNMIALSWDRANNQGQPAPTYNVYENGVKIATSVNSPHHVHKTTGGTWRYKIEAVNILGTAMTSEKSGTALQLPSNISDFKASDNLVNKVTFTFSNAQGIPAPTYDLYQHGVQLAAQNIQSGFTLSNVHGGVVSYHLRIKNSTGFAQSNTDIGTALQAPNKITNFRTVSYVGHVRVYFSHAAYYGHPAPTHDLYEGNTRVATNIPSGYQYYFPAGVKTLHVRAVNSVASVRSNEATATSKTRSGSKGFETAGTHTFTAPIGYSKVTVTMCGGGGAGSSSAKRSTRYGGGGYAGQIKEFDYNVTNGQRITVVVGAGGKGGRSTNATWVSGGAGGASKFANVTANGGKGGSISADNSTGYKGAGDMKSTGISRWNGQQRDGARQVVLNSGTIAYGGERGMTGAGGAGASFVTGGEIYGQGGVGRGAGGGAAVTSGDAGATGGNGTVGYVSVTWS